MDVLTTEGFLSFLVNSNRVKIVIKKFIIFWGALRSGWPNLHFDVNVEETVTAAFKSSRVRSEFIYTALTYLCI